MFERYTDKARRAVFFARYEASQSGSSNIVSLHLLLGLLRDNSYLFSKAGLRENSTEFAEICHRAKKYQPAWTCLCPKNAGRP